MLLLQSVLSEEGTRCGTSTSRDLKTISARVEHEGISFLTISLPNYCQDFQKSLANGFVSHDSFLSFKKTKGLPRLFGGFLDLVFDRASGRLLGNPSLDAIRAIRQFSLMFAKINIECTAARTAAAMKGFIECEKQVRDSDSARTPQQYAEFGHMSMLLWREVFTKVDKYIYDERIMPKHGPGATSDRLRGNAKYIQKEWPVRLDKVFSHEIYLIPHWRYLNDIADTKLLEPGEERPVRVVPVPKTQKTPRIIAIEPTCMQYMQQGIMEVLVKSIESHKNRHSWIVGFSDQKPNQFLAQSGSLHGDLATLDLSEASDRVSNQLVRELFSHFSHLREAVEATRSRKAEVLGYGVKRLAKFASMGSALCFPIEALVFSTLVFLGIQDVLKRPLTLKDINSFKGRVRVYGDDIIVPVEYVSSVVSRLEAFGFLVNASKSFWTGSFRESCGKDFYQGEDVTVVRLRTEVPTQRHDVEGIVSMVSFRNQLYKAGLWKTTELVDRQLEGLIKYFPAVGEQSPVLGRHTYLPLMADRMHPGLQKPLVKGFKIRSRIPKSNLDGYGALLKFFLKRGDEPIFDREHLTRYGRAESVDLRLGWHSAL